MGYSLVDLRVDIGCVPGSLTVEGLETVDGVSSCLDKQK